MEKGHWPTAKQALDLIPWPTHEGARFLDLGCGNGFATRYALQRLKGPALAVGIDLSPSMTHLARARTGVEASDFVTGAIDALPFPPESFDVAYSNEALYYVAEPSTALAEIHRVLKPGGTFTASMDYFEENPYSTHWPEQLGVSMVRDSEAGWRLRVESAGFGNVTSKRLLDASMPESASHGASAEEVARQRERHAWATTIGTLLLQGVKPDEPRVR